MSSHDYFPSTWINIGAMNRDRKPLYAISEQATIVTSHQVTFREGMEPRPLFSMDSEAVCYLCPRVSDGAGGTQRQPVRLSDLQRHFAEMHSTDFRGPYTVDGGNIVLTNVRAYSIENDYRRRSQVNLDVANTTMWYGVGTNDVAVYWENHLPGETSAGNIAARGFCAMCPAKRLKQRDMHSLSSHLQFKHGMDISNDYNRFLDELGNHRIDFNLAVPPTGPMTEEEQALTDCMNSNRLQSFALGQRTASRTLSKEELAAEKMRSMRW